MRNERAQRLSAVADRVLLRGGQLRAGHLVAGRLRALDAQGLDPLLLLVLPRVLALSLSTFCLTMLFVTQACRVGPPFGSSYHINRRIASMSAVKGILLVL